MFICDKFKHKVKINKHTMINSFATKHLSINYKKNCCTFILKYVQLNLYVITSKNKFVVYFKKQLNNYFTKTDI